MLIRDFPLPCLIPPPLDFRPNLFQHATTFQLPAFWGTRCHALGATLEGLNYIKTFPTGTYPNGGSLLTYGQIHTLTQTDRHVQTDDIQTDR